MPRQPSKTFTDKELEIMKVIWKLGEASARQIQENLSGPTIYTPGEGQPGFSTDSPLGDSFRIFSTPDTGSTLLMLGAAIAGLVFLRWKMVAV